MSDTSKTQSRELKIFGQIVRGLRKDLSWTQSDLAKRMKCSQVSIHRIETGEQEISLSRAFEIIKIMAVDP